MFQLRLITAKVDDIKDLIEEGVKSGIWSAGWKPEIRGEFPSYLQEKVKNITKRNKIMKEKGKLAEELRSCGALL